MQHTDRPCRGSGEGLESAPIRSLAAVVRLGEALEAAERLG